MSIDKVLKKEKHSGKKGGSAQQRGLADDIEYVDD